MRIERVKGREILDSRGNPALEVEVWVKVKENIVKSRVGVPAGASKGKYEAKELRDGDKRRYLGRGLKEACNKVNTIINDALYGKDPREQKDIDSLLIELDGTEDKSNLGANAIIGTSLGVARAAAYALNLPLYRYLNQLLKPSKEMRLPKCYFNLINGGVHADNPLSIQEFIIVSGKEGDFREELRAACEIYHNLKIILKDKKLFTGIGDEGGFAPQLKKTKEALSFLLLGIEKAGYKPSEDIKLALDIAASELYVDGYYLFSEEGGRLSPSQLHNFYSELIENFPIVSIEDPFAEDDWGSWQNFTSFYKDKIQIVGDDLFTTNLKRLKEGQRLGAANAILVKPNQIGTLWELREVVEFAYNIGYKVILSHRSGETEDDFLADLGVALGCGQLKAGAPTRGERICKYNRLLRIEEEFYQNF